ncbi:MAG: hypothetical protein HPY54_14770 [Chthonomonadetes bacterium]|nr:hypothetical protein [Chthonomonadetes bacterium]
MEVTLYDFSILQRNFGAIGAEPFDSALPRQQAPDNGYGVRGLIELEDWQGESQTLLVEALRDDDPDQIVYQKTVQSGQPFMLYLPQPGVWTVKVRGTMHFLSAQSAHTREYHAGPPIYVALVGPKPGEEIADARESHGGPYPIAVEARVVDYDGVRHWPAGRRGAPLANRELQPAKILDPKGSQWLSTFSYEWQVQGASFVDRGDGKIELATPRLEEGEASREITVRCTVRDVYPDVLARRDLPQTAELKFKVVNHPTIRATVTASDGGTPIPSGYDANKQISLTFQVHARPPLSDNFPDENVEWVTPWGNYTGKVVNTGSIAPDTEHGFFNFSVTVKFSDSSNPQGEPPAPPPPGNNQPPLTIQRNALMAFDLLDHDEWNDTSRGRSNWGSPGQPQQDRNDNPPNWFDDRSNHWGSVIPRMNSKANGDYIVHYADVVPGINLGGQRKVVSAVFDWKGEYAPAAYKYAPAYRGRIYVFPTALYSVIIQQAQQQGLLGTKYGLRTDRIDFTAMVIAHEFAHRDLFIRAWGGFSDEQIGGPGNWWPGEPNSPYDADQDWVKDLYEDSPETQQRFHFSSSSRNAILRWWTGDINTDDDRLTDDEMYAQLWGEWEGYEVGSLVIQEVWENDRTVTRLVEKDFSRGGWLEYFYPNGK